MSIADICDNNLSVEDDPYFRNCEITFIPTSHADPDINQIIQDNIQIINTYNRYIALQDPDQELEKYQSLLQWKGILLDQRRHRIVMNKIRHLTDPLPDYEYDEFRKEHWNEIKNYIFRPMWIKPHKNYYLQYQQFITEKLMLFGTRLEQKIINHLLKNTTYLTTDNEILLKKVFEARRIIKTPMLKGQDKLYLFDNEPLTAYSLCSLEDFQKFPHDLFQQSLTSANVADLHNNTNNLCRLIAHRLGCIMKINVFEYNLPDDDLSPNYFVLYYDMCVSSNDPKVVQAEQLFRQYYVDHFNKSENISNKDDNLATDKFGKMQYQLDAMNRTDVNTIYFRISRHATIKTIDQSVWYNSIIHPDPIIRHITRLQVQNMIYEQIITRAPEFKNFMSSYNIPNYLQFFSNYTTYQKDVLHNPYFYVVYHTIDEFIKWYNDRNYNPKITGPDLLTRNITIKKELYSFPSVGDSIELIDILYPDISTYEFDFYQIKSNLPVKLANYDLNQIKEYVILYNNYRSLANIIEQQIKPFRGDYLYSLDRLLNNNNNDEARKVLLLLHPDAFRYLAKHGYDKKDITSSDGYTPNDIRLYNKHYLFSKIMGRDPNCATKAVELYNGDWTKYQTSEEIKSYVKAEFAYRFGNCKGWNDEINDSKLKELKPADDLVRYMELYQNLDYQNQYCDAVPWYDGKYSFFKLGGSEADIIISSVFYQSYPDQYKQSYDNKNLARVIEQYDITKSIYGISSQVYGPGMGLDCKLNYPTEILTIAQTNKTIPDRILPLQQYIDEIAKTKCVSLNLELLNNSILYKYYYKSVVDTVILNYGRGTLNNIPLEIPHYHIDIDRIDYLDIHDQCNLTIYKKNVYLIYRPACQRRYDSNYKSHFYVVCNVSYQWPAMQFRKIYSAVKEYQPAPEDYLIFRDMNVFFSNIFDKIKNVVIDNDSKLQINVEFNREIYCYDPYLFSNHNIDYDTMINSIKLLSYPLTKSQYNNIISNLMLQLWYIDRQDRSEQKNVYVRTLTPTVDEYKEVRANTGLYYMGNGRSNWLEKNKSIVSVILSPDDMNKFNHLYNAEVSDNTHDFLQDNYDLIDIEESNFTKDLIPLMKKITKNEMHRYYRIISNKVYEQNKQKLYDQIGEKMKISIEYSKSYISAIIQNNHSNVLRNENRDIQRYEKIIGVIPTFVPPTVNEARQLYDKVIVLGQKIQQVHYETRMNLYCNITGDSLTPLKKVIIELIKELKNVKLIDDKPTLLNLYLSLLEKESITDQVSNITGYLKMKPHKSNTINIDLPMTQDCQIY